MNTQQTYTAMPLGLDADILSALDDAEYDDYGLTELLEHMPAVNPFVPQISTEQKKRIRLYNTAWVVLCLVILTGAALFSLHMLAK